jgi:hypothetical protein
MNLSSAINALFYGDYTIYEPVRSTRTRSVRELKYGPMYIGHRFPFKGGITPAAIMARNVLANNVLLTKLKSKRKLITDETNN